MVKSFAFVVSVALLLIGCGSSSTDVLIASKPSNAIILLDDVEIGLTPMKITVTKEVNVEIRKKKFISYKATLSADNAPNLLVKLEPDGKDEAINQNNPVTVSQLRNMYNTGKISQSDYNQRVRQVKSRMDMDLRAVKTRYSRGELSKSKYNQLVKQIKHRYLG
jgi:uncharacterized membrane protein